MTPISPDADGNDPYAVPKSRGIFTVIHSINNLTSGKIIQNIIMNRYCVISALNILGKEIKMYILAELATFLNFTANWWQVPNLFSSAKNWWAKTWSKSIFILFCVPNF